MEQIVTRDKAAWTYVNNREVEILLEPEDGEEFCISILRCSKSLAANYRVSLAVSLRQVEPEEDSEKAPDKATGIEWEEKGKT